MITNLKPYPAYKDSGVEWLGKVPEHWEVVPLRRMASGFNNGTSVEQISRGTTAFPVSRIETISTGTINYDKVGFIREENVDSRFWLEPGDILLSHINSFEMVGNCAQFLGERPLLHGMNLIRIRPKNRAVGAFMFRFMKSAAFRYEMRALCKPAINQVSVTTTAIKGIHMPLPPLPEQTAICRFLDWADTCIHKAIRARKRRIKLLEEYKQALIHQAVTGQIDVRTGQPYPAYKDSGVEWLGQVPEHWGVVPLKRIAWFKSGTGFPVGEQGCHGAEIPFLRVSDMTRMGNDTWIETVDSTVSRQTAQRLGAFVFPAASIIFPKVGGALLTNKRRLLRIPSCIDNNVMGCVVHGADLDYAFTLLQQLDLARLAKPGPVPAIGEGDVREIKVGLPPSEEQTLIMRAVRGSTASLVSAILSTRREIELLLEYRERIIADVVTGKLDVREAAASLPEESAVERGNMDEAFNLDEEADDGDTSDAESDEIAEEDAYAD
jgi:type I restriction enzyme S subunit